MIPRFAKDYVLTTLQLLLPQPDSVESFDFLPFAIRGFQKIPNSKKTRLEKNPKAIR